MQHLINDEAASPGLENFVFEFYCDRLRELEQMCCFIRRGDLKAIGEISHRWKGYCDPYGFQTLARLGGELEHSCASGEHRRSQLLIKAIASYLELKGKGLKLV